MKPLLALALALLALPAAHAAEDQAERERLKAERTAIEARFNEQEKACRARFAVTDCVKDAQRERNAALGNVRRQERILNDAERKQRAAERQKELEERNSPEKKAADAERRRQAVLDQQEREARAAEKAQKKSQDEASKAARAASRTSKEPSGPHGPQGTPRAPHEAKRHGPTPEEAAKNRAAYEARLKAAEEHNAQLREKAAKRKKPAASDLPIPQ